MKDDALGRVATHLMQIDQYIALAKTDVVTINISLNEMYFIHSLLELNLSSMVGLGSIPPSFAPSTHLWQRDIDQSNNDTLTTIMKQIGNAPAQLPRKDNANVDLELDKSVKREAGSEEVCSIDQTYTETKHLLFCVMKAISESGDCTNIQEMLEIAVQLSKRTNDRTLGENVDQIKANCQLLEEKALINREDDYAALRMDAAVELLNHENLFKQVKEDQSRLSEVLESIDSHHSFLQEQFDAYKQYLGNVRQQSAVGKKEDKRKSKKTVKSKKEKPRGPFKYTHVQLEKDGVIMESEAPADRLVAPLSPFSLSHP